MSKDKLLPCPFCGGEAEVHRFHDGDFSIDVYHSKGCILLNDLDDGIFDSEDYEWAVAAWNSRACDQCEGGAVPMTDEAMAEHGWVRERTCHVEAFDDGMDEALDGGITSYSPPTWYLSCGHTSEGMERPNYCPNCSAKVVER